VSLADIGPLFLNSGRRGLRRVTATLLARGLGGVDVQQTFSFTKNSKQVQYCLWRRFARFLVGISNPRLDQRPNTEERNQGDRGLFSAKPLEAPDRRETYFP